MRAVKITSILLLFFSFICTNSYSQKISVQTNTLSYLALGTFNIELGYPLSRHYSLQAQLQYNPFSFGHGSKRLQNKHIEFSVGVKYWSWFVNSGWNFSSYFSASKYSFSGLIKRNYYEGRAFGLITSGGYALLLSKSFNLEFGIGAFLGVSNYTQYSCVKCGARQKKESRFLITPANALIGVTYLF